METNQHPKETLPNYKEELKLKGWSYRTAAPLLGVSARHLCLVLAGKRKSEPLCRRISELPPRKKTK